MQTKVSALSGIDSPFVGYFDSAGKLPAQTEPAWALVGDLATAKPYAYYVVGNVPSGYSAGWNDLSGVLGTYDFTILKDIVESKEGSNGHICDFCDEEGNLLFYVDENGNLISKNKNVEYQSLLTNSHICDFCDEEGNLLFYVDENGQFVANFKNDEKDVEDRNLAYDICIRLSDFLSSGKSHSQSIKDALDFVSPFSRKLIVFDVDVNIDEAILLDSNTTVLLKQCTIKQNDDVFDNVFRGKNVQLTSDYSYIPDSVESLENIRIIGDSKSRIIGCDINKKYNHPTLGMQDMTGDFYGIRTHMVNFSRLSGGEFYGISFSLTRGWCLSFELCSNLYIHDLTINSNVKNGDGIDLRCGCTDCRIERIKGSTSDDMVACTALGDTSDRTFPVGNTLFTSEITHRMWKSLKDASPDALDIRNIMINDVDNVGAAQGGHGIICLSAYGSKVTHVSMNNIREAAGQNREAFIKLYTGYGTGYNDNDISDIRINNVEAVSASYTLMSNCKCNNVWANKLSPGKNSITYKDGFTITN